MRIPGSVGRSGRHRHASSRSVREAGLKKLSELRCCPELRNGVQFLERRRARVGETPDRSRFKLLVFRFEIEIMHSARKMLWSFESVLDESLVDHDLGPNVGQLASPVFHLLSHRLKVALHPVNTG